VSKVCWVRKDIDLSPGELHITANQVHILRDSKLSELYCGYSLRGNYDSAQYSSTESYNAVNRSNFGLPSGPRGS
jgi:hypothetical protein